MMAHRRAKAPVRRTIPVVEDDEVLRMVLRMEFEKNGFSVREARHGRDALASIIEMAPDIIVTDIMMPVMDGFSFIDAVRKSALSVPIIAMSAVKDDDMRQRAMETGANRFCVKPITPETLLAAIEDHLPTIIAM